MYKHAHIYIYNMYGIERVDNSEGVRSTFAGMYISLKQYVLLCV